MKSNFLKAGILVVILVIPALVFIFLKLFGKNNFDLPYYFPVINERDEVKIVKGDTVFNQAPAFQLISQNGDTLNSEELKGKIFVTSFFFSRCGTICPPVNTNLSRVQENFKHEDLLKLVSITVDPAHDSSEVLKAYSSKYGALKDKWYFLTGDKAYIYNLAIKGFKLPTADASEYDKGIESIDETFIHSDKLLLIDGGGYFRGIYEGTDKDEINRLIVEIKVLLDHQKKQK